MAVDLLAVVNDGSRDFAASLEGIRDVTVVGRFLCKPPDRLFTFGTRDSDLIRDLRESSRSLCDYRSVDLHLERFSIVYLLEAALYSEGAISRKFSITHGEPAAITEGPSISPSSSGRFGS
jgi:hypothetical protein